MGDGPSWCMVVTRTPPLGESFRRMSTRPPTTETPGWTGSTTWSQCRRAVVCGSKRIFISRARERASWFVETQRHNEYESRKNTPYVIPIVEYNFFIKHGHTTRT